MKNLRLIPPSSGASFILKKGDELKIIDIEGEQVADLFCIDQHDKTHFYSSLHTLDFNDSFLITKGNFLFSNRCEKMMEIVEDTCGRHDLLMPPCSLLMYHQVTGTKDYHPSCLENLTREFLSYRVNPWEIGSTFNIFMNVEVNETKNLKILPPTSKKDDFIILRSLIDLVVGLTACSHEETNGGRCKSISYQILAIGN